MLKKELDDATLALFELEELDIFYDDEFLLKANPEPTLVIKNSSSPFINNEDIILCGTFIFTSYNKEGETVSLSDKAKEPANFFIILVDNIKLYRLGLSCF